jgi:hypothetical protein
MNALDRYEVRARLLPVLVSVIPLLVSIFLCFPSLRDLISSTALLGLVAGLSPVLAEVARTRGKALETRIRSSSESATLLSWKNDELSAVKSEIRSELARRFPEVQWPSQQQEIEDGASAHKTYTTTVVRLFPSFRDPERYPLVHAELTSYGFRRNLMGLKPLAVSCSVLGALLAATVAYVRPEGSAPIAVSALAFAVCCAAGYTFVRGLSLDWIRAADKEYVRQLLLALVHDARTSNSRGAPTIG